MATAFFIEEPPQTQAGYQLNLRPVLESLGAIRLTLPAIPAIQAIAADAIEASRPIETAEDAALAERLQGIYVKQINARVARALEEITRLRAGESRRCVVNIIQSDDREVLDISIESCDRDAISRQQLLLAIRAASPLPAPPEGLAQGSYLTLDLSSMQ
jgi:hypothetical protein